MKFTKKMAAMIAGMMTIAAMGGMTAFADTTTINNDSATDPSGNKSVSLNLTVTSGLTTQEVYQSTPTWNVVVSAPTLEWSLTGTETNTYTLEWNPTTKSYTAGTPSTSYSTGAFTSKEVSITNNSNFVVNASASVSTTDFTLDKASIAGIQAAGGTGGFTITPRANLTSATSGTATFTFEKYGDLVAYQNNAVTDTSATSADG